jgi:hypothetical protein
MEIGRPHDANPLFAQALAVGERAMTLQDRQRIAVSHLQALIAARKLDAAQTQADALTAALPDVPRRLSLLTWIERVRLALVRRNIPEARAALAQADAFVSPEQQSFSRVEIAQAGAELALAEGDCSKAEQLLRSVIARYGADDLAGREVGARIQRAQALAALGRRGESDRELSAALRRALQRGLVGYADQVRAMIAARGGSEHAFLADVEASGEGDGVDLSRFVRGRPLGSGGYGAVTRAYDLELGVEVAIKRFAVAGVYDVTERARLLDAARNEIRNAGPSTSESIEAANA